MGLLSIYTAPKKDLDTFSAELVNGSSLTMAVGFVPSSPFTVPNALTFPPVIWEKV